MEEEYIYTSSRIILTGIFIYFTTFILMILMSMGGFRGPWIIMGICMAVGGVLMCCAYIPAFFEAGKRSVRFGIFGIVTARIYYDNIREIDIGHEFKRKRYGGYYQEVIHFTCGDGEEYTFYSNMDNVDIYAADPKKLERDFSEGRFERLKDYIYEIKNAV